MTLPAVNLDDRDFQSLVDEARLRIAQTCPQWNEHNVSDPGITLIELFAWMTDQLIYRVNRIPDKVQVAMLELLGIQLGAPEAAETELRLRLAAPPTAPLTIPAHRDEIATKPGPDGEPVTFRIAQPVTVPVVHLTTMMLARRGRTTEVEVRRGVARPTGRDRMAFSTPPRPEDLLYLGFHAPLARLVIALDVTAERARGAGIDPHDPPWRWEVSAGGGTWIDATVLTDETGGFNKGSGTIELQIPPSADHELLQGHRLNWLRCTLPAVDGKRSPYTHPPILTSVGARVVGVLAPAEHAATAVDEIIGYSDGTPGQTFALQHTSALPLGPDDGLDVLNPETKEFDPWQAQESFADSDSTDRHYVYDPVAGEIQFGPLIREGRGWRQRGAIPKEGQALRMRSYHYGGGATGNVRAHSLTVMRRPIAGVTSVTNPEAARGGVDAEPLQTARWRAATELRTRYRAVTAHDFELLACEATRRVARAHCVEPDPGQAVAVRILPTVRHPETPLALVDLQPTDRLLAEVAHYLDERRLMGTTVHVTPVALRGVTVVAEVQVAAGADVDSVAARAQEALSRFINPHVGGSLSGDGEGWDFGRPLRVAEVEVVLRRVPGVLFVSMLRIYEADLATGAPAPKPVQGQLAIGPEELVASARHLVHVLPTGA